jgi:hypothetical protein
MSISGVGRGWVSFFNLSYFERLVCRSNESVKFQADNLPYINLIYLFLIIGVITVCTVMYMSEFISIVMFILAFGSIVLFAICSMMIFTGRTDLFSMGCGGFILSLVVVSVIQPYFSRFSSSASHPSSFSYATILPFFLTLGMFYLGFRLISEMFSNPENNYSLFWLAVLSVFFSGISIPFIFVFLMGSYILFPVALLSVSIPVISALAYPTIKQKRLVSKYHDSEEDLIRP